MIQSNKTYGSELQKLANPKKKRQVVKVIQVINQITVNEETGRHYIAGDPKTHDISISGLRTFITKQVLAKKAKHFELDKHN